MRWLRSGLAAVLDVLAPPFCAACDAACLRAALFCPACARPSSVAAPESVCGVPAIVAGRYAPPLSTAIQRFKYQGRADLDAPLARLLSPHVAKLGLPADTVYVPVPLHVRRLVKRGYNQAALLAQALAARTGHGCEPRLLVRERETDRQVGKARAERLENLHEAFRLRARTARSVVLVDDVITTGSTVRECAQTLRRGGVKLIAVVALAAAGGK